MKEKKIYILQVHTGTIPSKIVKIITNYEYSHVLLSTDNSFKKMYSFGRRTINNPLNGGFIIESYDGLFFKKYSKTKCRLYELKINDAQYSDLINILKEYEKEPLKYNYDFLGAIGRTLHINVKRKNHYVCSQFVAEVMEQSKIYKFDKPTQFIKPVDFEGLPDSEIIYDGYLYDIGAVNV